LKKLPFAIVIRAGIKISENSWYNHKCLLAGSRVSSLKRVEAEMLLG